MRAQISKLPCADKTCKKFSSEENKEQTEELKVLAEDFGLEEEVCYVSFENGAFFSVVAYRRVTELSGKASVALDDLAVYDDS